ncbi:integral membrane protein DUF6 [Lactarius vividus]|nr:integral membrane protein DUF6 [Lactarius vividus]
MTNASKSDLLARREDPPHIVPDETSPLLKLKHAHGPWRSALSSFLDDNTGLLLVAASQVFFSAMNMAVKLLNSLDEPCANFRVVITYAGSVAYMYWKKIPHPLLGPKGVRTLLVFRGFSGFLGLSGVYFSLQYLSLSDATVLTFMVPIFTGFSGAVFLKEALSLRELLAGSFLDSLFGSPQAFLDPEVTPTQRMLSVMSGGITSYTRIFSSLYHTLIRAIGKRAHVLHSMMSFSLQCVLGSTLGMIWFKFPIVVPTRVLWLVMLFLIGIFGFLAQTLLTMGLQRETAGRGSLAIYTSIVFATMFEFTTIYTTVIFPESPFTKPTLTPTQLTKQTTAVKPVGGTISERSAGGTSTSNRDHGPEA